MHRILFLLSLVMLLVVGCAQAAVTADELAAPVEEVAEAADTEETADVCTVTTPVKDQPPDDPNADPFGYGDWYINEDRTMWVNVGPGWHTGGEKVTWIRPAGMELTISGRRLDGDAPPLRVEIPAGYGTGFQIMGVYFPTEGCWAVTATAGEHRLDFVTQVSQ